MRRCGFLTHVAYLHKSPKKQMESDIYKTGCDIMQQSVFFI